MALMKARLASGLLSPLYNPFSWYNEMKNEVKNENGMSATIFKVLKQKAEYERD